MKLRPDLLDAESPQGMEVLQLTTEEGVRGTHVYMEAQIFTPDSRRFVLHRSAGPHGGDKNDPEHRYLLCDIENGCSLSPITDELGPTAPSLTPDGKTMYYFVDRTEIGGGSLTLKKVELDGTKRETVMVIDGNLPGTPFRPSRIYPLSTISSDGKRLALSCFFGNGRTNYTVWGLLRFDLDEATVEPILYGHSWCNVHPQYSRSPDPEASHDILIQENHGNVCNADGHCTSSVNGLCCDIHVIRDDGTRFREMPWGRDGEEYCQGHQCWRGRTAWGITSTGRSGSQELIEGTAAPYAGHRGKVGPEVVRNDLSRGFDRTPRFCHFGTDINGTRLVTDFVPDPQNGMVYLAELGEPGKDAVRNWTYLLNTRSSVANDGHLHPFCSPDGRMAFFNSNESGILQAYMIRGL